MPARECGEARQAGGLYACCGMSPFGKPIEEFLIDPPYEWLEDPRELINRPQSRIRPAIGPNGEIINARIVDHKTGLYRDIHDLYIWVGAEYYPYAPVYIEEVRRLGLSRRIPTTMDLSVFTAGESKVYLIHPKAYVKNWEDLSAPGYCPKNKDKHVTKAKVLTGKVSTSFEEVPDPYKLLTVDALIKEGGLMMANIPARTYAHAEEGPCLGKLYDLIPRTASASVLEFVGQACDYKLASGRVFQYFPTDEQAVYIPGVFASLPLQTFEMVKEADGSIPESVEKYKLREKSKRGGYELKEVDE